MVGSAVPSSGLLQPATIEQSELPPVQVESSQVLLPTMVPPKLLHLPAVAAVQVAISVDAPDIGPKSSPFEQLPLMPVLGPYAIAKANASELPCQDASGP